MLVLLLASAASAPLTTSDSLSPPLQVLPPSDVYLGAATECRLVRQITTPLGAVTCCDSCRSGMLLKSTVVRTTVHLDTSSVHEQTLESAASIAGKPAEDLVQPKIADSGSDDSSSDDTFSSGEAESEADRAWRLAPKHAPRPEKTAVDVETAEGRLGAVVQEQRSVETDVVDTAICNTCVSAAACLEGGNRINTWHRTCY